MLTEFGTTKLTNGPEADATRLRLADGPLQFAWQHCGETSDFIGGFFAAQGGATGINRTDARHSIGYLMNELLENAFKFRAAGDVVVETSLDGMNFELKLSNFIGEETALRFQKVLGEITVDDPGELLIRRIEENAAGESPNGSGLGLLTLMSDYGARLGWRFSRSEPDAPILLETYAALPLS
jgi:hypothetical protein